MHSIPDSLYILAISHRDNGSIDSCISLLENGISSWPNYKDKYGHFAFQKELLRTYLFQGLFDAAHQLMNKYQMKYEQHSILFAREYLRRGQIEVARPYFITALNNNSNNDEILNFFKINPPLPFVDKKILDQFSDISKYFPNFNINVFFDIGANIGQTVEEVLIFSENANIHCFEPINDSFSILKKKFSNRNNILLNNFAASSASGHLSFSAFESSTMNRVSTSGDGNTLVEAVTIDSYCSQNNVGKIDYMKIDTEGHELEVLRGCERVLHEIGFIELEASMNLYNDYHTPYHAIFNYMTSHNFSLFKIYEQVHEWRNGGIPVLRRSNPLFVSNNLIAAA